VCSRCTKIVAPTTRHLKSAYDKYMHEMGIPDPVGYLTDCEIVYGDDYEKENTEAVNF
jgi:hypothetical protein